MDKTNLKQQSEEFFKLISLKKWEKEIIFDSWTHIWFSIKKDYPGNIWFSRIKKTSWEDETKCLIRIWYRVDQINKNNEVDLFIDAWLWHDILQNIDFHVDWDLKDIDPKSIEKFNSSRLPLKIHGSIIKKYIYNTQNHKFYTKKRRKEKSLREIVDDIFKTHTNSIRCFTFYRVKSLIWLSKIILWLWTTIFYKFILKEIYQVEFKDEDIALIKAQLGEKYKHDDLKQREDKEGFDDIKKINKISGIKNKTEMDLPFFGWKFKINRIWLIVYIITLAILGLFFRCGYIVTILEKYNENEVIQIAIALLGLFFVHLLFQYILTYKLFISILNLFIKTYKRINSIISINGYDIEVYDNPFKRYSK